MADVKNTVLELNTFSEIELVAGDTKSTRFDFTPADNKMVLIFNNTASGDGKIKILKGNGLQGVVDTEEYTIKGNKMAAIRVDSGAFKNVSGDNNGYVIATCSAATITVGAIQLP